MIGDVLFFKSKDTFFSKAVSIFTKSEYSHVGLIVAYDELTNIATIIESNAFIKTRLAMIELDKNIHTVYTVEDITDEQRKRMIMFAYRSLGVGYDYIQIFGLFISLVFKRERNKLFNSMNKLICSELIDLSYFKAGISRKNYINLGNVTPVELLEVYEFKVRKGV